jgi:hypothetical protein
MRRLLAITAAFLFLFLVVSVPAAFSQSDEHPAKQEDKAKDKDQDKGRAMGQDQTNRDEKPTHADDRKARPEDHNAQQDESRRNDTRPDHQQGRPSGDRQDQQNGTYAQQSSHRPMQERGQGRHIPETKFRASFGHEHRFHVDRDRIYNQPQPVVVYGGYSFQLAQAWPESWAYSDDCYIDYDDVDQQYYLYDTYHPGMRIVVIVIG